MAILQLISPPMIAYRGDIFATIPSPPIGLASIAAYVRQQGFDVNFLDCFGENPHIVEVYQNDFIKIGLKNDAIIQRLDRQAELIGISVHSGMTAAFCLALALEIKKLLCKPVVVGGPHVTVCYKDFLRHGVDFAVLGEGEQAIVNLLRSVCDKKSCHGIQGVVSSNYPTSTTRQSDLPMDSLPFPAWDMVPLKNYWSLKMSHSPIQGKFAPMITSRGCPFNCAFCSTPATSGRKWRGYSPERTIAEIEYLKKTYGVEDIFIQDDNFNVDPDRVRRICELIVKLSLNIRFSLPSGVRLEKMSDDIIDALAGAGFKYLCLAPESGSSRVCKRLYKPLDKKRLFAVQKRCRQNKIRTGAFIILGTPFETCRDVLMTSSLMAKLIFLGVDDVSIFIFAPVPGSKFNNAFKRSLPQDYLGICWSPKWREDYIRWAWIRRVLYFEYIVLKLLFQPHSVLRHLLNIKRRRYETKGEMGLRRLIDYWVKRTTSQGVL